MMDTSGENLFFGAKLGLFHKLLRNYWESFAQLNEKNRAKVFCYIIR